MVQSENIKYSADDRSILACCATVQSVPSILLGGGQATTLVWGGGTLSSTVVSEWAAEVQQNVAPPRGRPATHTLYAISRIDCMPERSYFDLSLVWYTTRISHLSYFVDTFRLPRRQWLQAVLFLLLVASI